MGREHRGEDGLTTTQRMVRDSLVRGSSIVNIALERGVSVAAVNAVIRTLRRIGKLPAFPSGSLEVVDATVGDVNG